MGIKPRPLLITLGVGGLFLVALNLISYLNSLSVVEAQLRGEMGRDALAITRRIESQLSEREQAIAAVANLPSVSSYVVSAMEQSSRDSASDMRPLNGRADIEWFLQNNAKYFVAIAVLKPDKQPLFRAELGDSKDDLRVRFQTQDFLPGSIEPDERVWNAKSGTLLRSVLLRGSHGVGLRYTVPILTAEDLAYGPGALIVDVRLDTLLDEAVGDYTSTLAQEFTPIPRLAIVLDSAGNVVYHTNAALKYQPVATSMPPAFAPVTNAMKAGQAGWRFYDSAEGHRWLAVYQPIKPLDLSVAVAGDYSMAVGGLRFMGWTSIVLTTLTGALMAALLWFSVRRTSRQIVHVTEGTAAIARGELDQPIEVRSSDETHLLAETINAVKERLREQMAREAEMRQFDSFMRLSAMLTHDLKNSILTLSLIVSNMKEQFYNDEFREDAMKSLTEATDKMRAMVAKLSEPVRSLSGEFKRPRPVDLIPIIERVLARTVEPASSAHRVETHLPSTLTAIADEERIEKVLENLVLNAIEAMGAESGKLTVEAGDDEEGFVFFSVTDTGPGMSEEFQRTRLFRPFSTTKPKGIGLGLYASRELVRSLGGQIKVESERGSGTTFRVVLPSGRIGGKD
ncbi:MAG TPA: ATP-binding protein [Pyrinomonadaceae bacterium]